MGGIQVELTDDLTRYDSRLTVGSKGVTCEAQSMWARGSDDFVGVRFENGACLDVLWRGLKIIDKEHLDRAAAYRARQEADVAKAKDVVLRLGPKGGFRSLSYRAGNTSATIGFKDHAERLLTIMRANGVRVREIREESRR